MTIPRPGRPIGSGLDDEAALDAIEALAAAEPELSQRAAIVRISGDADADVRRLQSKLAFRARARAGDARRLLAAPFEHGEVRKGRLWAWIVEVPAPDRDPFAVAMAIFVGQPVLEVVDVPTEMPVAFEDRPSHPIVLAIRKLPRGYDWDDPSYRICCDRLGVDPDRDRPARYETQVAAASAAFGGPLVAPVVDVGAGTDGCATDDPDIFEGPTEDDPSFEQSVEDEAETARRLARAARWQLVEDGMAFDLTAAGTYDPHRLSDLHARYSGSDDPDRRRSADEARDAFDAVDWSKASASTDLRWLANPWGYDHHASIHLLGSQSDGLSSWSGKPEFIAPVRKDDLVGRRAVLAAERNAMAIMLSEAEMASFEAGGDRAYWATVKDWHATPMDRLRARIAAPDLEMTRQLIDAMVANACEAYVSRASGGTLDPKALPSCERREPIAPSQSRWAGGRLRRDASRANGLPYIRDGRLELPWGDCFIGRSHGRIVVRPGTRPLFCNGHSIRLSVDLIPSFDGRYLPLVAEHGFDATDLRTGGPVPVEVLRCLLRVVTDGCTLLAAGRHERSMPVRRRLGWAAAGFGTCLLAIGDLSAPGGAENRMRDLTQSTMAVFEASPIPKPVGPTHGPTDVPKAP